MSAFLEWRPIFHRRPDMLPVAEDARAPRAQMAHFVALTDDLPVSRDEQAEIIEAMQLCERLHGYAAISDALERVAEALRSAVLLTGVSAGDLARRRSLPGAGALVGALVETMAGARNPAFAGANGRAAVFEPPAPVAREGSPHVELEDCLSGAEAAFRLARPQLRREAALAYSALMADLRIASGQGAVEEARALAERNDEAAFIGALEARPGFNPSPIWKRYSRMRRREQESLRSGQGI